MGNRRRILVVDDEIHIVHVVAIKLRNSGYEVLTSNNPKDALGMALNEKPDVLVVDNGMPGMTGLELVEKLRANEETKDIPVVMLSDMGDTFPDVGTIERLGISACLSKPFSPRELLEKVSEACPQQ
jgi:DNA-binding response OmpR family regulator